jgi:hypothetical protein
MDPLVPPALGWPLMGYGVCLLIVVVAIVVAWREHVGTQAMRRRMDADQERDQRLAENRDRLYLEGLPAERRAREPEVRARLVERERRAQAILAQEEAARGNGADGRV